MSFESGIVFNFFASFVPTIILTISIAAGRMRFSAIMWGFDSLAILSTTKYDASSVAVLFWLGLRMQVCWFFY